MQLSCESFSTTNKQNNLCLSHRENASPHVTPDVSSSEISSSLSSVANGAEVSLA